MMIGMVAIVASALVFMVVYCVSEDWKNDRKRRGE
jgi:hypothetical protein